MKHPFQNIVTSSTHLFATVKNHLLVYKLADGSVVGRWEDSVNTQDNLKRQQLEKIQAQETQTEETQTEEEEEPEKKRGESNTKTKIPKIPTPGPGAPPIYNYIRCLELTSDGEYLIGTTDSDKSIIIFQLDFAADNCLKLIKRQIFPKRPSSISATADSSVAFVGDKFGDVYKLAIDSEPPVDEKSLKPILGHVSMLTDVLTVKHGDKQFLLTSDRDEHIKVSHYPQTYVIKHWLFGHDEFISSMVIPSFNEDLLVTAGGDDNVFLWNWYEQKLISTFNLRPLVEKYLTDEHLPPARFLKETSRREISVVKLVLCGRKVVVLVENVKCLLSLHINDDLSFSLDKMVDLECPLVDISCYEDVIVGAQESDQLVQLFGVDLSVVEAHALADLENPCTVESKNDFYPLYTMNSLRKRSEH